MKSRRKFLADCSTAAAGLALVPLCSSGAPSVTARNVRTAGGISYGELSEQINTLFRTRNASGRIVELTLLKAPLAPRTPIGPNRRPPADAGNEKFSLIFSGPLNPTLPAAIHEFEHERLGRLEMYLGLIGMPAAGEVRYQAVFNQPATTAL